MSAQKRRGADDMDGEDSNVSSSPFISSSQGGSINGRKRQRVPDDSDTTPEQLNGNAFDNSASDEDSDDSYDSDNTEENEAADLYATQALHDKRERNRAAGNEPRESGVLEMVTVYDFMCHHYFEFKVGPLINFICGKNGSGKSAILTAIILCLGGKASHTNRGSKMASLIKEGADRARIICKIANRGEDAYMHDTFGDSILVERHFSRGGTSGYKVSGVLSNKIHSTKKVDVEKVIDHFCLQIDNPMNVLSQDMARSFIAAKDPGEKYKHFLKGVQLELLDQDYHVVKENVVTMAPKLELAREEADARKRAVKDAKKKRKLAEEQASLDDEIRRVRRQAYWAAVQQQEAKLVEKDKVIDETRTTIATLQAGVADLEQKFHEADELHKEKEAAYEEVRASRQAATDEKLQLTNAYNEARSDVQSASVEAKDIQAKVRTTMQSIRSKEQEIESEEQRIQEAHGGGAAQRIRDLEIAKQSVERAKNDLAAHREKRATIEDDLKQAQRRVQECQAARSRQEANVKSIREKLRELQNRGINQDHAFRRNNDKLEQAIQRETGWRQKPIGPIGRHVRLKDPEWSSVVERVFGRTLTDYVVFSKQDADLFDRLRNRVNCDAQTMIINTQRLTPLEPDSQHNTILRVLDIDSEWVTKHLVISSSIEQSLLVKDLDEATSIMYNSGRLKNVKACYTKNPNVKQDGILLRYSNKGEPMQDPVEGWKGPPRMKGDHEATKAAMAAELNAADADHRSSQLAYTEASKDLRKIEANKHRYLHDERSLVTARDVADDEVQRLLQAIAEDQTEDGGTNGLKIVLEGLIKDKEMYEAQYRDALSIQDDKRKIVAEHKARVDEIEQQIAGRNRDCDRAQTAAQEADHRKTKILRDKNEEMARVKDAEGDLAHEVRRRGEVEGTLQEYLTAAQAACQRIEVPEGETYNSLVARYQSLTDQKARSRQRLGYSLEVAAAEEAEAEIKYAEAKKDFHDALATRDQLLKTLDARRLTFSQFKTQISARARASFKNTLSERGFRGDLLIDHTHKRLELRVEPDLTKRSGEGREAKSLSGGEKSYAQICMLLAIWEAMGSPIRCLDEFDVFMDAVNRNISVRLITEAARSSSGMQYILISPGSKADIVRAPDVSVCDLGEPDRTGGQQRTLDESGFGTTV